ncbi:MAG: hypothetical protein WCS95_09745, partial [Lentisphaeria bacterium]
LAASARLAGHYVPEIIDKLKDCGIDFVELDYLQGRSVINLSPEKLQAAVAEFRQAGIQISALRLPCLPADFKRLLEQLQAAAVERLILPLPHNAETLAMLAEHNIAFDLCNSIENSAEFRRLFAPLAAKFSCQAVFNPRNFVLANEHPFLHSWRIGRFIKSIGQLDVADLTWDQRPARLARGNAEIKELISILRCHHFSGWLTLGGGALYPGSLQQAQSDFLTLLDNM